MPRKPNVATPVVTERAAQLASLATVAQLDLNLDRSMTLLGF